MRPFDPQVLPHLLPARRPLAVVLGAGVAGGVLTLAQAWALGALVVRLVTDPAGTAWHGAALALLAVVALRALAEHVGDLASARAAARVSTTLRHRLLDASTARARSGPDGPEPDALVLLATRGATSVEPYVTRYLPALVLATVLPPLTVAAIWWLDWLSGLIVLLTLPLVPVFAALVGMTTRDRAALQWRELGILSGHFLDVVRGLPTLVAHRRAEAQVARIGAVTERYRRATVDTLRLAFASSSVLELVATLSVALVAVCVGLRLAGATIGFETALVVLLLAPEAYWPLRRVGAEFHAAAEGTAALTEATHALAALEAGPVGTRVPASTRLALVGLAPGHPGSPQALTDPLGVELPDLGLVAVAGPSGCGKSTLLQTLRGELAAYDGRVLVGGVDLADVDPDWWHRQVSWLPQRPWLSAGTVRANLLLGAPVATDAQLWGALAELGMDHVVAAHPDGLDRRLGEDGAGLSAGQRARLAMARVVLADRPVVLLDEPTAHLDEVTEQVLLEVVRTLAGRALVVVVAHRPAVLAAADLVVDLHPRAPATPPAMSPATRTTVPDVAVRVPAARPAPPEPEDVPPPAAWAGPLATVLGVLSTAAGRGAHGHRRVADHPRQHPAPGARPDGGHRRRADLRPRPAGAAARRAPALPRRRPARAGPAPDGRLRRTGAARARRAPGRRAASGRPADLRGRRRRLPARRPAPRPPAGGHRAVRRAAGRRAGVAGGRHRPVSSWSRWWGSAVLAGLLGRLGARVAEPEHVRRRARTSALVEEVVRRSRRAAPVAGVVRRRGRRGRRGGRPRARRTPLRAGRRPPRHVAVRLATGVAVVAVAATVPAGAVSPATLALLLLLPARAGRGAGPAGRRRRALGAHRRGSRPPRPLGRARAAGHGPGGSRPRARRPGAGEPHRRQRGLG